MKETQEQIDDYRGAIGTIAASDLTAEEKAVIIDVLEKKIDQLKRTIEPQVVEARGSITVNLARIGKKG